MTSDKAAIHEQPNRGAPEKLFTVADANRALVLVRRIVADIVAHYTQLLSLRRQRQDAASRVEGKVEARQLQAEIDQLIDGLNQLHSELWDVGCILKDWSAGLVDFPSTYQGRKVWLCWKLGEPAVTHWHDLSAGFAGRQPIGPDFA